MSDFYKAMENRRTIHHLSNEAVISQERLEQVIGNALNFTPTAFNAQEQRLVLLTYEKHVWFWNQVKSALKSHCTRRELPRISGKD